MRVGRARNVQRERTSGPAGVCPVYPEDIETLVYRDADIVPRLHSFLLLVVVDDEQGTPRPAVALELTDLAGVDEAWRAQMSDRLRDGLRGLNIAYRSSIVEIPAGLTRTGALARWAFQVCGAASVQPVRSSARTFSSLSALVGQQSTARWAA